MNTLLKKGEKCEYKVKGMHCAACELVIERKFAKSPYMKNVNAILHSENVVFEVEQDIEEEKLFEKMNELIVQDGYSVVREVEKQSINYTELSKGFLYSLIVIALFIGLQKLGIANLLGGSTMSLPFVFMIGIVASLSSCMAIVGGLVLSISSSYAKTSEKVVPLLLFHGSRLLSFFILGGLIGFLGSLVTLGQTFYFVMSMLLFLVMLVLGMNLINVFPFFRKFQLRMPKALTKKALNADSVHGRGLPLLLGMITFFLPCGFTQSMQVAAMATGSLIHGALIMFIFALGTLPVLALISFTSVKLANSVNSGIFFKTAGFIVLFFAVFNFLTSLVAAGIIAPFF